MCGIGGYFGEGNEAVLRAMNYALAHRGPDGEGVWEGSGVGFAHRRLAVIDLSPAAAQPMHRGALTISFNGEIYNYRELREELEARGVQFVSRSDTEVILALFEREGESAFRRLEGMFALALYDRERDMLYLARDRFGEKPLYYYRHAGGTLIFASEPKALFAHAAAPQVVSAEGLAAYLAYDTPPAPLSLWEGIAKVAPATYLVCTRSEMREEHYWQPSLVRRDTSFPDAEHTLNDVLKGAVEHQLVSDVPLGVFLSGGIDSSLIAAYAQEAAREVHSFSIGFEERSYDESLYARTVAKHLGTIHHERIVGAGEVRDALLSLVKRMDEPIADPALLPLHLLALFARERITVALTGDGSDELFLGYPTFLAERMRPWYTRLPRLVRRTIVACSEALPQSQGYMSTDFKLRQFLRGAEEAPPHVHRSWLAPFSEPEMQDILAPAYRDVLRSVRERDEHIFADTKDAPPLTRSSWWYARTILDLYLTKADRASMYASLETRSPFLDRAVAEYALSLPSEYKLRGRWGKYVLRKLAEKRLPRSIAWRDKHGFGLPVGRWFTHEWRDLVTDVLSGTNVRAAGLCDVRTVSRLLGEHLSGARDHRKKLYSLLLLHLWYGAWVRI